MSTAHAARGASTSRPEPRLRSATWAVVAVFFLAGFAFASWASRLPAVRDVLGLSEAQMGLTLLFVAIGSIIALPLSGRVVDAIGASRAVLGFAAVNTTGLVLAVLCVDLGSVGLLRCALLLTGIGTGVWDAAMNLEGAAVEQRLGRAIMPQFHAAFSFGTVTGAGLGALAAWGHVGITVHLLVAVLAGLVGVAFAVRRFLPPEEVAHPAHPGDQAGADPATAAGVSPERAPAAGRAPSAWTEPRTLMIGLVVLAAALTEGAANDWVGLAVVDGFDAADALGAVGLAVFLSAMTGMRLLGTGLLDRHGRVPVLRLSAGLAIVGLVVFALVPSLWVALCGVVLWGMGAALGFPVGMSAASDDPRRAAGRVSVVATIGYSAFFVGPPLIGFLAEQVGYREALLIITVPLVLGLFAMGAVRPLPDAVGTVREG
ncbi:MFS transporter [Cellulomonas sp. PhB143]|uniref:MFS transporter n=1 Tax=Cellulomonas sp. PhB143 TaxID=2485186 RepID=UPI000F4996F3|nr:MFS transporter [Cellulomonas sp. PhB143]ROS76753.1 fucose permease [Cellulomonas sp. PhB143]